MLTVKKYGGSSVSTPEKILKIAEKLKSLKIQGEKLIVIVSAMGDTTDDLVELSRRITTTPVQREMDMLLSSGERISMALMAMALNSLGCEAISFTGSQSGVFTDHSHNNARLHDIKAIRVAEELEKGKIVIIAGFQGVNPQTKEVTTLGRGGSDTTAVAMAAAFNASSCDILTDVKGLYSVDPRIPAVTPKFFPFLDYELTMEMAYWGARVLHYRSVELAERKEVPLLVHLSSEEGQGTVIGKGVGMELTEIKAVNYSNQVGCLKFQGPDLCGCLSALKGAVTAGRLATPQIFYERKTTHGQEIFITAPRETFDGLHNSLTQWCHENKINAPTLDTHWNTVTLTGRGLVNSPVIFEASETLRDSGISVEGMITTSLSITFIVPENSTQKAVQTLHQKFC